MGFLEDLILIVKESVEEAKGQQQARPQRATAPVLPQVRAQPLTQRVVVEPAAPRQPPRRPPAAPVAPVAAPVSGAARIARLLRQPRTMRELVVLKEILDKPLALRRGRR